MTVAWTLYVLLVGALLTCAAVAVDDILRRTSRPTRWVWVATLLAIVAFAAIAPRRQAPAAFKLPLASVSVTQATLAPARGGIAIAVAWARNIVTSSASTFIGTANRRLPAATVTALGLAWMGATATLLLVLVGANRRVRRERRHWPLADVGGAQVRLSPSVGPAVIGLAPPEIVVPRWLLDRSADEQRLVIVHEREHVAAHDQLLLLGGLVVAALLPWHPAVWFALARLRLAIELDCDTRVLRRGVARRSYGALLIDIAGQCAGHRVGALALADRPSHLERRLLAMKNAQPRFTIARTGALAAVAMLAVAMACEARLPTSAEVQNMDAAGAEQALVKSKIMLDEKSAQNMIYRVDGVVVSAAAAHAIAPERIATVNVMKGYMTLPHPDTITWMNIVTTDGQTSGVRMKVAYSANEALQQKRAEERGTMLPRKQFDGILFVDGKRAPQDALASLSPESIESVTVLKGAAAMKFSSDPAAANGIIQVVTKGAKK